MASYSCLEKQIFGVNNFKIVPIRYEDRIEIMKWRNEQIYHLRQEKLLTIESQNHYFDNIISNLFSQESPDQLLFSFLENEICVGYGGLVHINWVDKNAEISFIMKTDLENNSFHSYWLVYLGLIELLAFNELNFHKIYTYAFDLRPQLYDVLKEAGFREDARLNDHCLFESKFIDVVIHAKIQKSC